MSEVLDKLKIKVEEATRFELDYNDFDRIVEEVYGHRYEFTAYNECNNDSYHPFQVSGKVDDYVTEEVQGFLSTGKMCCSDCLMQDLAAKGVIPKGQYYVEVCW